MNSYYIYDEHGGVNSMAVIESWGVIEGGIQKEMPPGGVVADGQKYARSLYFNIKFGVLRLREFSGLAPKWLPKITSPW